MISSGMRNEMMPRADNATNLLVFFFFIKRKTITNPHITAEEAIKDAKIHRLT